ncbi:MAG: hypothetical protein ACREV6_08185 [Clostridium sp.]|uniref:hypothetical protein n=1 Tax=Clostridium sp. TaxID=1506 RepID=UPI003D6CC04A
MTEQTCIIIFTKNERLLESISQKHYMGIINLGNKKIILECKKMTKIGGLNWKSKEYIDQILKKKFKHN